MFIPPPLSLSLSLARERERERAYYYYSQARAPCVVSPSRSRGHPLLPRSRSLVIARGMGSNIMGHVERPSPLGAPPHRCVCVWRLQLPLVLSISRQRERERERRRRCRVLRQGRDAPECLSFACYLTRKGVLGGALRSDPRERESLREGFPSHKKEGMLGVRESAGCVSLCLSHENYIARTD